jgi:formylglycine-generating enzyme required for sulfatase activity
MSASLLNLHSSLEMVVSDAREAAPAHSTNGRTLRHDMTGNVWQWVWDRLGLSYYTSSPGRDPRGPASGSDRVARGVGWFCDADICRVALRNRFSPDYVDSAPRAVHHDLRHSGRVGGPYGRDEEVRER